MIYNYKKQVLFFFAGLILSVVFARPALSQNYRIELQLKGAKDSLCILGGYWGSSPIPLDTAMMKNNRLIFSGKEKLPTGLYFIKGGDFMLDFPAESGNLKLSADIADIRATIKAEGSENARIFTEFMHIGAQKEKETDEIRKQMLGISTIDEAEKLSVTMKIKAAETRSESLALAEKNAGTFAGKLIRALHPPQSDYGDSLTNADVLAFAREHHFDHIDTGEPALLRSPALALRLREYLEQITPQHPDSIVAATGKIFEKLAAGPKFKQFAASTFLKRFGSDNTPFGREVFAKAVEKYFLPDSASYDSAGFSALRERYETVRPRPFEGKPAPNFILLDTAGNLVELNKFEAKYTVLFFYDPSDKKCHREAGMFKALQAGLKKEGAKILSVCVLRREDVRKAYLRAIQSDWTDASDPHGLDDFITNYLLTTVPRILILDENKIVLADKLTAREVPGKIQELK